MSIQRDTSAFLFMEHYSQKLRYGVKWCAHQQMNKWTARGKYTQWDMYYSVIQKNEILSFVAKQMKLEDIF
jgi:hypothetical protein